jgi:hypothetical protein
VWIPEGVTTVRGAVCNPFSRLGEVSAHWQAACRHWRFAYVQTDFDAVKKEEFTLLKTALTELAKKCHHPELEHMPLCFTGMSRGGGMSMSLAELMPERTLASVPVCLEVGPTSAATRHIPVMTIFGEKDGRQMQQLLEKLPTARKDGARWAIAPQWDRKHEFGQANNLSFVFLDDVIDARLPKDGAPRKPPVLRDLSLAEGWLGDPASWGKDGRIPMIQRAAEFRDRPEGLCWFPTERTAAVWRAFVGATKEITIQEPLGLGDGQRFVEHRAGQPIKVRVAVAAELKPEKLELWDGDRSLAERAEAPWSFEVSLKPGIHAIIATVDQADQPRRTSRPHTIIVAE